MFSGSIPALVTPFRDGVVDEAAFRRLVEWQVAEGSSALVPCGTTGEAPTITSEEQHRLFELCIEAAAGKAAVIAGCGSNDTQTALWHMQVAKEMGADAALLVAPYYNRPGQAGLLAHFSYLAEAVDLPIVLYNVPGRTVTDIKPETVIELARRFPARIIGIKDATGDMTRITEHRMALGMDRAHELNQRLYPLHRALFTDASPGPVKYALSRLHTWLSEEVRLPLVACSAEARKAVDAGLERAGLI
jgi:4-hydroxy-tetrahydrodipicolinate synthase